MLGYWRNTDRPAKSRLPANVLLDFPALICYLLRMIQRLLLTLFVCNLSLFAAEPTPPSSAWDIPDSSKKFHIFLLMGQSNMSGFGLLQPADREPVPHVLNIPTNGPIAWHPAAHPLHNRNKSDRFGLGLFFAKAYFKANRIPFVEYDVEKSAKGRRDYKRLRAKGVPVIVVGGKRMNGFSRSGFDQLYSR